MEFHISQLLPLKIQSIYDVSSELPALQVQVDIWKRNWGLSHMPSSLINISQVRLCAQLHSYNSISLQLNVKVWQKSCCRIIPSNNTWEKRILFCFSELWIHLLWRENELVMLVCLLKENTPCRHFCIKLAKQTWHPTEVFKESPFRSEHIKMKRIKPNLNINVLAIDLACRQFAANGPLTNMSIIAIDAKKKMLVFCLFVLQKHCGKVWQISFKDA